MNSFEIPFKFKNRLNKGDSQDYQNIGPTEIQEVINKAALGLARRTLHGFNQFREGKEGSKTRISDFQVLLKTKRLSGSHKDIFFISGKIPTDYFEHSQVTGIVDKKECISVTIPSDLIETSNVNTYLSSGDKQPSFDFEQSFHTLQENKIKFYHNNDFTVKELEFVYYKKPQFIEIPGAFISTGGIGKNMEIEFKDDLMEIIIDEAVRIKAEDIESLNRQQLSKQSVETDI